MTDSGWLCHSDPDNNRDFLDLVERLGSGGSLADELYPEDATPEFRKSLEGLYATADGLSGVSTLKNAIIGNVKGLQLSLALMVARQIVTVLVKLGVLNTEVTKGFKQHILSSDDAVGRGGHVDFRINSMNLPASAKEKTEVNINDRLVITSPSGESSTDLKCVCQIPMCGAMAIQPSAAPSLCVDAPALSSGRQVSLKGSHCNSLSVPAP